MCDEYADILNKQQLSFCVRWVDQDLNACEDFLGFYEILNIKAQTIVTAIKYALIRFNLSMSYLRGLLEFFIPKALIKNGKQERKLSLPKNGDHSNRTTLHTENKTCLMVKQKRCW